jgi:hypothetical protein
MTTDIFDHMGRNWGSEIVARTEIPKFTGGMISAKYLANLDCQGLGPERIKIGRKTGYPLIGENGLISWLRNRASKSNG